MSSGRVQASGSWLPIAIQTTVIALVGFALLGLGLPQGASATSGSISGVTVDPALASANVQNLSVSYDGCSTSGVSDCSWKALAWLEPPPATSCSPNGSWVSMGAGHPPGSGPPPRRIWEHSATGDALVESGPLTVDLGAVNDQHLCLYATDPPSSGASASASSLVHPAYTPALPESSALLASQLLHVDLPAAALPTSEPTIEGLHFGLAKRALRRILAHRFPSWRRSSTRHLTCTQRLSPTRIRCPAISWRTESVNFEGAATIWVDADELGYRYRIVARRRSRKRHSPAACAEVFDESRPPIPIARTSSSERRMKSASTPIKALQPGQRAYFPLVAVAGSGSTR